MTASELRAIRSPVGSFIISVIAFAVFSVTHMFTTGKDVLFAALIGLLTYYAPRYSPLLILGFLLIPLYTFLASDVSLVGSSNVNLFYASTIFLVLVAFSATGIDWLGASIGIFCGLLLKLSFSPLIVVPSIIALSIFRNPKSGAAASVEIALFGVYFQISQFLNLSLFHPSSGIFTLFSPQPSNSYGLLIYIFGLIFGGSKSIVLSYINKTFVPVYFILAIIVIMAVAVVLRKYAYRLAIGPFSSIVSSGIVGLIGSIMIFNLGYAIVVSTVITVAIGFVYLLLKPSLGTRPTLSLSSIKSVFYAPVFTQSGYFENNDGVSITERPGRSDYLKESWTKLAGVDEVKEELTRSTILPMKNKEEARRFGVNPAKGILLYGPPGTGKTTMLRGLAAYLGMRYIEINPGNVLSKWFGESEQKVKQVFDDALSNPPCIIAIDEIDGIGRFRDTYSGDSGTSQRVLNVILMGMDSIFKSKADVLVVATTNRPDLLDKALLRPGRFDKIIYMGPPGENARASIFRSYLQGRKGVDDNIDYLKLAKMSERFTGADIEGMINKVLSSTFYDSVQLKNARTGSKGDSGVASGLKVTQQVLEEAIKSTRPSTSFAMIEQYERFRAEYQRERKIQKGWESGIPNVRFSDIGDLESVKEELKEAFELPLKEPEMMEKLKIRPVKGILLYGPPGNGKTLLAKAVATEFSTNFFVISGAELSKDNPAQAASRIRDLFNVARDNVPSIIFLDELDQIAPNRSNPAAEIFIPVTNQLLSELDGIRELKGVMVLGATNRPESVDPALLRANRLERHIEIPYPNVQARKKILEVYLAGIDVSPDVSLDSIAEKCDGFSGADIQELVNEAKKSVLRRKIKGDKGGESINPGDFESALKIIKETLLKSRSGINKF